MPKNESTNTRTANGASGPFKAIIALAVLAGLVGLYFLEDIQNYRAMETLFAAREQYSERAELVYNKDGLKVWIARFPQMNMPDKVLDIWARNDQLYNTGGRHSPFLARVIEEDGQKVVRTVDARLQASEGDFLQELEAGEYLFVALEQTVPALKAPYTNKDGQ